MIRKSTPIRRTSGRLDGPEYALPWEARREDAAGREPGAGGNNGGYGTGRGTGTGTGGRGSQGERETIVLRDVRNRIRAGADGTPISRELHFTPGAGGQIEVAVQATGVNVADNLRVVASDCGDAGSGVLSLDVVEGERCSVTVSFDEPYGGPIELLADNGGAVEASA